MADLLLKRGAHLRRVNFFFAHPVGALLGPHADFAFLDGQRRPGVGQLPLHGADLVGKTLPAATAFSSRPDKRSRSKRNGASSSCTTTWRIAPIVPTPIHAISSGKAVGAMMAPYRAISRKPISSRRMPSEVCYGASHTAQAIGCMPNDK